MTRVLSYRKTLSIAVIGCAVILSMKLVQLQLMANPLQNRASAMLFQKKTIYPSRGLIYDRNQNLLVYNEPVYDLMVTFAQIDAQMDTSHLCSLLEISKKEFESRLNKNWRSGIYSKMLPFIFMSNIPPQKAAMLQEFLHEFPGFFVQLKDYRKYPFHSAPHVIGYISEVSRKNVQNEPDYYSSGDYRGVTGLEYHYEELLRGTKGYEIIVRDYLGREVEKINDPLQTRNPLSGVDLITTLDINLQEYAENLMQNKKGSVVALDPTNGEVLAMVSAPFYNPDALAVTKDRGPVFDSLQRDPNYPFLNRSLGAMYPPGSIFKCLIGAIALDEGLIDQKRYVYCSGGYSYDDDFRKCHEHPNPVNIVSAIQYSCNSFFFEVFRELVDRYGFSNPKQGYDSLYVKLREFGLGTRLNIDMPSEKGGNLPSSSYYDTVYKNKGGWKSPTIMSLGIGQGELEFTPLQIANLAAIIANNGTYYVPHLVREYSEPSIRISGDYTQTKETSIKPEVFDIIEEGMQRVVDWGTGYNAQVRGVPVCGKTGTAQNPHGKNHSVFFAYAPRFNPKIAVGVVVENAGDGNWFAAPIAGLLIEKYLNDSIPPYHKYLENRIIQSDLLQLP